MNRSFSKSAAAAFALVAVSAVGQVTSGNIAGVVKDSSGAVIPDAQITIKSEATGVVVNSKANSSGEFLVQNLLPAKYDITATAAGFAPTALHAVNVTLNSTATADLALQTGQQSTMVEVNASSEVVLDTTTQNLSQTFSNEETSTLPSSSIGGAGQSGVLNLALLAPGVASSGGVGIGVGPSIGGQRPRSNNFMIEGVDNNNKSVTGPLVYVPNDAVGDFTLITNQFSPEFGHSAGGQFNTNIVTGTNKFHGRVYEYFQNRDLNAASGIAGGKVPNPRYDNNRYGGQLGGPILHDKLFFFGSFERNTVGQNDTYYLCTPTAGGLATLNGLAGTYGFSAVNLGQYAKYTPAATLTGQGGAGIDASVDNACGSQATGAQFLSVNNAAGTASTNIALGNYLVSQPFFTNFDALTTGVDWTISPSDSMRFRYIYNTEGTTDVAANLPAFFQTVPLRYDLATISEFHNFTPNLINEIRVGFNRYYDITPSGPFSYPGVDQFPNLTFYDQGFINVGPDPNAPSSTIQNLYQATDNVSWTRGSHNIRVGFDGRKYISPQQFTQRARGDYQWSNLNGFLHDLAPDSNGFGERSSGTNTYYGDQTALYAYVNDTWRATTKLTLNYGLRYEFTSVPVGERAQGLNAISSVPGLISFHAPQPGYTNLYPRVGVEYAPDNKTSIRLGFGLAGDVLFDNLGTLSFPPQYSTTQDVGSGTAPAYSSPNFLANGGLPPGNSGAVVLSASAARAATSAYLPNQVVPYSENYTLTVQRNLSKGLVAEVGYIGTRGIHLPTQIQYNVQPRVNSTNLLPTLLGNTALEGGGANTTNLANLQALSNILPQFAAAGFTNKITSYQPYSGSSYNGLIANLQGRMRNGLQLNASYTYSKTMDDATAEVFATVLTPRRPQNSQNLNADYSRSALDRTHRVSLEADYLFKPFLNKNWVARNVVGNWTIAPIYTYESPEYATALSGVNSNLNGDSGAAIDRPLINPNGVKGTGSAVTPIVVGGQTVGYSAVNPKAYYIEAGPGTLPTASRNTLPIRPIDNIDLAAYKRFTVFEHYSIEFGAQAFNVANHAQYIPGSVDNVNSMGYTTSYNFQTVTNAFFNRPDKEFLNNARTMQLSAKFLF